MIRADDSGSDTEEAMEPITHGVPHQLETAPEVQPAKKSINFSEFLAEQSKNAKRRPKFIASPSIFCSEDLDSLKIAFREDAWVKGKLFLRIMDAVGEYAEVIRNEILGCNIAEVYTILEVIDQIKGLASVETPTAEASNPKVLYGGSLDEKHAHIIQKFTLPFDDVMLKEHSEYNKFLTLVLFECKTLFEDILNAWLLFLQQDYPLFRSLGLDEFESMAEYILAEIKPGNQKLLQLGPEVGLMLYNGFLEPICPILGLALCFLSTHFKNHAKSYMVEMEKGLAAAVSQTNFLTMHELQLLKTYLKRLQTSVTDVWFIRTYAKQDLLGSWFEFLFETVLDAEHIAFSQSSLTDLKLLQQNYLPATNLKQSTSAKSKSSQPKPQFTLKEGSKNSTLEKGLQELNVEETNELGKEKKGKVKKSEKGAKETEKGGKNRMKEIMKEQSDGWLQKREVLDEDEQRVWKFLAERPNLDARRRQRLNGVIEGLMKEEVEEELFLVSADGRRAKGVRLRCKDQDGEQQLVIIETDKEGNKIASYGTSNQWFEVDQSYVQNSSKAADILSSKPGSLPAASGTALSGAVLMAGSGALGSFLFKLVQGKEKTSDLSKDLAKDTGMSLALSVFVSTMPHVAIAVGSVLGVKAMVDLQKNKFIRRSKKIFIVTDILARTGAKTACAVGGAITGQSLIPVPFLGAFVGGMIGGFTATAVLSSYDSLVAKRISLEQLTFYCLMQLSVDHGWKSDHSKSQSGAKWLSSNQSVEPNVLPTKLGQFLEIVGPLLKREVLSDKFLDDLRKKESGIHEVMEELFATIAVQKSLSEVVDEGFHGRWKTAISVGILNHYNYLFQAQLQKVELQAKTAPRRPPDAGRLPAANAVETFLLSTCGILDALQQTLPLADAYRTADRVVVCLNQMLTQEKLVTLFRG